MPASPRHLIDRLLPDGLPAWLTQCRDEGLSMREIQSRLSIEHGVDVSHTTIHNWCHDYGIEMGPKADA